MHISNALMLGSKVLALSVLMATPSVSESRDTASGQVRVERMVTGLIEPWGFAFLPEGGLLITLRDGELLHVSQDGSQSAVAGVPEVVASGQGGLLDVMLPRDFATSREVFLTYSKPQSGGSGTALGVGRLGANGLEGFQVLFEMEPGTSGGRHFGSRVVEGRDGFLYLTVGDRAERDRAQDLSLENGTVVRVARDGSVPKNNPFLKTPNAQPEIYSYGHRNPQGAALDAAGQLWVVEHGARGGDEINKVKAGANYGWPVISYGRHYSGRAIGEGTAKSGLEQPAFYWDPSIAPSGMTIYNGAAFPDWRGDAFVGSLKFDMISRLRRDGPDRFVEVERLTFPETERVRDVRTGPQGGLWFLSVGRDSLYRILPIE